MRRAVAAAALLAAGLACASAHNYLDGAGPSYAWQRPQPPHAARPAGAPWRVVSFNIAYGVEIDRALRVLRETPELADPDVLALQEMDAPGVERIARALGLNAVYYPSGVHPKYERDFGCALLSPWPLVEPHKVVLPHGARGSGLRRAAVAATVVRGEERVRAWSVHLPSPLAISGGSRRDELRALAQEAAPGPDPVLILGDFNSHGKVEELERHGFAWLTRELGPTTRFSPLGIPLAKLAYDHILARGLRPVANGAAIGRVTDNRGASDHVPIWALLERDPAGPAAGARP